MKEYFNPISEQVITDTLAPVETAVKTVESIGRITGNTQFKVGRRTFLKGVGLLGLAAVSSSFLAACESEEVDPKVPQTEVERAVYASYQIFDKARKDPEVGSSERALVMTQGAFFNEGVIEVVLEDYKKAKVFTSDPDAAAGLAVAPSKENYGMGEILGFYEQVLKQPNIDRKTAVGIVNNIVLSKGDIKGVLERYYKAQFNPNTSKDVANRLVTTSLLANEDIDQTVQDYNQLKARPEFDESSAATIQLAHKLVGGNLDRLYAVYQDLAQRSHGNLSKDNLAVLTLAASLSGEGFNTEQVIEMYVFLGDVDETLSQEIATGLVLITIAKDSKAPLAFANLEAVKKEVVRRVGTSYVYIGGSRPSMPYSYIYPRGYVAPAVVDGEEGASSPRSGVKGASSRGVSPRSGAGSRGGATGGRGGITGGGRGGATG